MLTANFVFLVAPGFAGLSPESARDEAAPPANAAAARSERRSGVMEESPEQVSERADELLGRCEGLPLAAYVAARPLDAPLAGRVPVGGDRLSVAVVVAIDAHRPDLPGRDLDLLPPHRLEVTGRP